MTKIALVGGGSVIWSMTLVRDLSLSRNLGPATVTLMDIDQGRLTVAHALATRYVQEVGAPISVEQTTSREKALEGAGFVVNAVKVDGYRFMEDERSIASKHGYYRGIDDKVSDYYGGFAAYRQLDFVVGLGRDMKRLCPEAWYMQTANPVFEGTTAVHRFTGIQAVGFCDGSLAYKKLARVLGLAPEEVEVEVAGFNHCVWLTKITNRGKDAYPLIDRWIKNDAEAYWKGDEYFAEPWNDQMSAAAVEMYRLYGLFPVGDTTRSVSPWWFHTDLFSKERWFASGGPDSEAGWTMYLNHLKREAAARRKVYEDPSGRVTDAFPREQSEEALAPFIEAMVTGREAKAILNVPNNGSIAGVPDDAVIEVAARIRDGRILVEKPAPLPRRLFVHVILPRLQRMERVLHAFKEGDRMSLILGVMEDPRTRSFEQAEALVEDILSQPWNAALKAHYR